MATQLLIYEAAVPITPTRHGKWSVEVGGDYAFSRNVNSVPLMTAEFGNAAVEYPIVFAGTKEAAMPVAILGMRGNENLYLTQQSGWTAKYIPAFVRRYPFVFSTSKDGKTFTLCIDEKFAGCNQEGRGQRLFDDAGKPTPHVQNVMRFLQGYQVESQRTQAFCKKLSDLNLMEPMQAQVTLKSGQNVSLAGFMGVNRDKLKAISGDALADLVKTNELELVYLHLQSLRNFEGMTDRLTASPAGEAKTAPETKN
jgi:hypothetical protein